MNRIHAAAYPAKLLTLGLSVRRESARLVALVGLGLVLPWACHALSFTGAALGPLLMPLMLPVVLAAFLLPLRSALVAALCLPWLSMATSGMPPAPVALGMTLEGIVTVLAIRLAIGAGCRWWSAQLIGVTANRLVALSFAFLWMGRGATAGLKSVGVGLVGLGISFLLMPGLIAWLGRDREDS